MAPRSDHTTNRKTGTPTRATARKRTDEKRRPSPAASTSRRRGAEKTEAVKKPKAVAAAKAPAKKRMPKNPRIERPEIEGVDPPGAAAHPQAGDVTTCSLPLFFTAARKYPLLAAAQEIELAKRIEKGDMEA